MNRFFKRLQKGLKTACAAAILATCWNVGQTAQAASEQKLVTLEFSGTISPTVNNLSHVFLIYGTGWSSFIEDLGAVKLGDFPAGQTNSFSVLATAVYDLNLWWFIAGLHGDISGGYDEGLNGVMLGVDASPGDPWNTYVSTITEETMFYYLLNDDSEHLAADQYNDSCWYVDYDFFSDGISSDLFDFSGASHNGQMTIEFEVVPEPLTMILFGVGGMIILHQRHRKD